MNLLLSARAIYAAIKDDEMIVAEIRCEYKELGKKLALDPESGSQITSATVNGQSFSKTNGISKFDRLNLLSLVIRMIDKGSPISSKTIPYF